MAEKTEQSEKLVCTCNDQWPTGPCPVCTDVGGNEAEPKKYGMDSLLVTDHDLVSNKDSYLTGFKFICRKCNVESILHYFNFCPNCSTKLVVQSELVRNVIKAINEKNRKK